MRTNTLCVLILLHAADPCLVLSALTTSYDSYCSSSSIMLLTVALAIVPLYILTCCLETSMHPHDVLEAEPELVSGYYVDHGAAYFMLLYLVEGMVMHAYHLY